MRLSQSLMLGSRSCFGLELSTSNSEQQQQHFRVDVWVGQAMHISGVGVEGMQPTLSTAEAKS